MGLILDLNDQQHVEITGQTRYPLHNPNSPMLGSTERMKREEDMVKTLNSKSNDALLFINPDGTQEQINSDITESKIILPNVNHIKFVCKPSYKDILRTTPGSAKQRKLEKVVPQEHFQKKQQQYSSLGRNRESSKLPIIIPTNNVKYRSIEQLRDVPRYLGEDDRMKLGPILSTQKKVVHVSSTFNNTRRLLSKSINENGSAISNNNVIQKSQKMEDKFTIKFKKQKKKDEKQGDGSGDENRIQLNYPKATLTTP